MKKFLLLTTMMFSGLMVAGKKCWNPENDRVCCKKALKHTARENNEGSRCKDPKKSKDFSLAPREQDQRSSYWLEYRELPLRPARS